MFDHSQSDRPHRDGRRGLAPGLAPKLFLAVALMALLAAGLAGFGIYGMAQVQDRLEPIVAVAAEEVRIGAPANQNLIAISRAEKNMILAESDAD